MSIQKLTNTISPEDENCILALSRIKGLGPHVFRTLLDAFGSIERIRGAKIAELENVVKRNIAWEIATKSYLNKIDVIKKQLSKEGICSITILNHSYPALLREISDPPLVLYYKGDYSSDKLSRLFAVVGTRGCSYYGKEVVFKLVGELVQAGMYIVSGMAFGIDTLAHRSAIANKGYTIAVLSGGVEVPSPRSNYKIYNEILDQGGCIISEFPPGEVVVPGMFASRNRIVSGLSIGTLVVEAGEKSGALITARLALDQGREVFAIPAGIFSKEGVGTNSLIKKGEAKLVQSVEDILDEFGFTNSKFSIQGQIEELDPLEQGVIGVIMTKPLSLDAIAKKVGMSSSFIAQAVTKLELGGKIARVEGNRYAVVRSR